MKLYGQAQHFMKATTVGLKSAQEQDSSIGSGYSFGVDDEGTAYGKKEIDRWNIAVGYDYNLSKRTSVYTAASYIKESMKN